MSSDFVQTAPQLKPLYRNNTLLQSILNSYLPKSLKREMNTHLNEFADKVLSQAHGWGRQCELNPPVHTPYSPWGHRIDHIETHESWERLAGFSAENGLIADGYERQNGEHSRLLQMAKLFLFHPSSAFFSCPLAMTDGAAKVLEPLQAKNTHFKQAFNHLTTRTPTQFWTSGQWMTEKTGGSDVSETSTIATAKDDYYLLSGVKWFSSSTTSEMALALARIDGAESGSRGLSLFYVPVKNSDGELNGIIVNRLKDKMGTKALPTAELTLDRCKAYLIGDQGKGVKTVSTMLNITRMYNSVCSVAQVDRALHLLASYSKQRQAFSSPLSEQPLFLETFSQQKTALFASMALTFEVAHLLGKQELGLTTDAEFGALRLLTPITKLFTAKQAVWCTSEALEGFGGAGYIEDTEIPVLMRDAQVFPIWEGATNVLSLDVLRVMRDAEALPQFLHHIGEKIQASHSFAPDTSSVLLHKLQSLRESIDAQTQQDARLLQIRARQLSWSLGEIYAGALMLQHSVANPNANSLKLMSQRWVEKIKVPTIAIDKDYLSSTHLIIEENYEPMA